MLRGHDTHNNVSALENLGQIVAGGDGVGNRTAGKKSFVDSFLRDRFADVDFMRPEANAMVAFTSEDDGESGAPRASADDGNVGNLFILIRTPVICVPGRNEVRRRRGGDGCFRDVLR